MTRFTKVWPVVLALLVISSCKLAEDLEKLKAPVYAADWALPILDGNITSNDLFDFELDAGEFFIDSAGNWSFRYDTVVQEITVTDVLEIPDIVFPLIDSINQVPFPEQAISYFDLKGGSLGYEINLQTGDRYRITLRLPEATLQGVPFEETFEVQGPGTVQDSFPLNGYEFNLTLGEIDVDYSARDLTTGQPTLLPDFIFSLTNLDLDYALGDFSGLDPAQINGKINIPLPSSLDEVEEYRVSDPTAVITVINSVGAPVKITGNQLDMISTDGDVTNILSQELEQGVLVNYPPLNEIGNSRTTRFSLNSSNSLLPEALSNFPQEIDYDFILESQAVPPPDSLGFVASTSSVGVEAEFIVPIKGAIIGHQYTDTAELIGGNLDGFEQIIFTTKSSNGFPFEVRAQAYFVLGSGVILDSLYDDGGLIFGAADVDQNGEVIQPFELESITEISPEKMDNIRQADAFLGFFRFETTDAQNRNVVIKDGYELDYKIRLDAFIKFTAQTD